MDYVAIVSGRAMTTTLRFSSDATDIEQLVLEAGRQTDLGEAIVALGKVEWIELKGVYERIA